MKKIELQRKKFLTFISFFNNFEDKVIEESIWYRVKQLRKEKGLTQKEFAKYIGIGGAALSKIENKETHITEQTIKLICSVFNVSEDWLRTGEGEMFNPASIRNLEEYIKRMSPQKAEAAVNLPKFGDYLLFRTKQALQEYIERMRPERIEAAASTLLFQFDLFDSSVKEFLGYTSSYLNIKQKNIYFGFQTEHNIPKLFESIKLEIRNGEHVQEFPLRIDDDIDNRKYKINVDVHNFEPLIGSYIRFKVVK
jgi:transcriptional regulator with XRE-family HTH domain